MNLRHTYRISVLLSILFAGSLATPLLAKVDRDAEAKKAIAAKKAAAAKGKNKKGEPPTPASLVQDMEKAVAFIARAAVESKPAINMKSKEARPFWKGLKTISEGLDDLADNVKDPGKGSVADGLEDVGGGMVTLATSWGVIRKGYPKSQVGRGVIALSEAYNTFLHHYGPAVARYKKGGKVTAEEAAEVAKAQTQLTSLVAKLEKLETKAKKNTYQQRLVVDLLNLSDELLDIKLSNVKSYCKFIYQWDRLENALYGYADIVEDWYPALSKEWDVLTPDAEAISGLFGENDHYYETWNYRVVPVANYGVYYQRTAAITTVTVEQTTSYESTVEAWSEETAVEEDSLEESEINEEIEVSDEEEHSLFEDVEISEDDHDGDGVSDEDDDDDGNDGIADADDLDDEEADEEAQADDDDDDDGIADDDEDDDQ